MKVDILTNKDVSFSRFRWWSDWIDVAVFEYARRGYLLQMKISRSNAKKFKVVEFEDWLGPSIKVEQVGDLIQMCNEQKNHNTSRE